MKSYAYDYIFTNDSEHKNLLMNCSTVSTIQLTNSDVVGENFEIHDILNEEEDLLFGSVCASQIKFGTTYQTDLADVELGVYAYPPAHSSVMFDFGAFDITGDNFIENQGMNKYKEVVGYDPLYDVLNTNYIDWYNGMFPSTSTTYTQEQFRNSFFTHVGISQMSVSLPNDSMTVKKTVSGTELKGSVILRALCACNGCFGRMSGRQFKYIFLTPIAQDLSNAYEIATNGHYISEKHAKYTVNPIDKLIIRDNDSELIAEYPSGSANNPYVMANNFLLYDKTAVELSTIAQNIYNVIKDISYTPLEIEVKGNPCFEVGDPVYFTTVGGELVKSYILKRDYVGFQSPHDTYISDGLETRQFTTDSFDTSLFKLRNKTNQLIRDLEHTESILQDEVLDPDNPLSLQSQIYQSASVISAKVDQINGQSGDSMSWEMIPTKFEIKSNGSTRIKADSTGTFIGNGSNGFQIGATSIYNGVTSMSDTTHNGIYLGTDGISLGKGKFSVNNEGVMDAKAGRIGNFQTDTDGNFYYMAGTYGTHLAGTIYGEAGGQWGSSGLLGIKAGCLQFDADLYGIGMTTTGGNIVLTATGTSPMGDIIFNGHSYNKCLNQVWTGTNGNYDLLFSESTSTSTTKNEGARKGRLHWNPYLERLMFTNTTTGAMIENPSNQTLYLRASHEADYGVNVGVVDNAWTFAPIADNKMRLGSPSCRWTTVYAINGTINTSDRNEKEKITELNSKITDFVLKLKPVSYKFKVGKRTHFGLIAQDVEETMTELGMTDMDFAGLCKDQKTKSVKKKVEIEGVEREIDVDEPIEGQYTYGLRYEEFIAPLIKVVQMLIKEVREIKNELKEIKQLLKGDLK